MNNLSFSVFDFDKVVKAEDRFWALILIGIAKVSLNSNGKPIIFYNLNDIPDNLIAWKLTEPIDGFIFSNQENGFLEVSSNSKDLFYFYQIYRLLKSNKNSDITLNYESLKKRLLEEFSLTMILFWNSLGYYKYSQFLKDKKVNGFSFWISKEFSNDGIVLLKSILISRSSNLRLEIEYDRGLNRFLILNDSALRFYKFISRN